MLYCYHTCIAIGRLTSAQLRAYRRAVKALPTRAQRRRLAVPASIFGGAPDELVYVPRRASKPVKMV